MKISASLALAAAAALGVACASSERQNGVLTVETTGARYAPNDAAIRLLSQQRCTHEAQCGHVGPGAAFDSVASCTAATDLDERSSVGVDACPYGVDQPQLDKCLAAIRARACSNPMPALADVMGCGHLILCR